MNRYNNINYISNALLDFQIVILLVCYFCLLGLRYLMEDPLTWMTILLQLRLVVLSKKKSKLYHLWNTFVFVNFTWFGCKLSTASNRSGTFILFLVTTSLMGFFIKCKSKKSNFSFLVMSFSMSLNSLARWNKWLFISFQVCHYFVNYLRRYFSGEFVGIEPTIARSYLHTDEPVVHVLIADIFM